MSKFILANSLRDFSAYGEIINTEGKTAQIINNGYALKYGNVATIDTDTAQLNLFRGLSRISPTPLFMVERHPLASQAFFPLNQKPWLAVVADTNKTGGVGEMHAYQINGDVGLNYSRGVWHHPLLAVSAQDFIVADKSNHQADDKNLEEHHFNTDEIQWLFFDEAAMNPDADKPLAKNPNTLDEKEFITAFGGIFEHSEWVAKTLWQQHKQQADTVIGLHQAMAHIILAAKPSIQEDLITAHPPLAAARLETLGAFSQNEQQKAGLASLAAGEKHAFDELNAAYTQKFGFPFIVSVAGQNKDGILAAMKRRLNNTSAGEKAEALYQIFRIARNRLANL